MWRLIYESYEVDFRFQPKPHLWLGGVSQSKITGMPRYNLANIVEHATDKNKKNGEKPKKFTKNARISGMIACEKVWIT